MSELIDLKHGLKNHSNKHTLIDEIVSFVKSKFPANIIELKLNIQLTKLVCDIIEDRLPNNKKQVDKLDVLLLVLQRIFAETGLNLSDTNIIKQQVEFLVDNKKIKGIRVVKKVSKGVLDWVSRKFL